MTTLIELLSKGVEKAAIELYDGQVGRDSITLSPTRKEFEGDFTLVVFPIAKAVRKSPPQVAKELGQYLLREIPLIEKFNVAQGFLNLTISEHFWMVFLHDNVHNPTFGHRAPTGRKTLVEFASPNTNKPLHLGHIRNILLGWSVSRILEAAGHEVVRVQIINDRGIAICKSMLAWQKWGDGRTPQSVGMKGDHFVGDYYVQFEKQLQAEYAAWQQSAEAARVFAERQKDDQPEGEFFKKFREVYFNEFSQLGAEARKLLLRWEAGDLHTVALWEQMNSWVYDGFDETYRQLGVHFDKLYYESGTYLLGKDMVEEGLAKGIFFRKEDYSVWCDLTGAGLDQKVILRSDGTSVYITQDMGTARLRYRDFGVESMVYVVADEQNYHFQVLFEVLRRLGEPYASHLYHLNYGMVDLPSGKMKSREGTVVDADDLMAEVVTEAAREAGERGELAELPEAERTEIIRKIGMAALKFFIIKVAPRKRMTFDPKESVDLQGQTGPYVQNAYVRVKSVLRKAQLEGNGSSNPHLPSYHGFQPLERELLNQLYQFPTVIEEAAHTHDPSHIAGYCYNLAKEYHRFYHELSILRAENEAARDFRILLSQMVANVLAYGMDLLGIEMPDRM